MSERKVRAEALVREYVFDWFGCTQTVKIKLIVFSG